MRDVRERAAMDEGGVVLQRLHQVGLHRLLEQHRHRPVRLDVPAQDRRPVAPVADDDVAQPPLQILQVRRQAQDRHHLRGHRDVEARLAREPVGHAAQRAHHLPQRPVVHVHHPPEHDPPDVDLLLVPPVDVVVEHRRQKVVRRGDRVEIPREMQVHVLHRHHLRAPAARGPALHPEARAQAGLADADRRLLADRVQPVPQAHRRRRLALARRRRVDRRHQNQAPVRTPGLRLDELRRHLRLVMAERNKMLARDPELPPDLLDRLLARRARDLDVGHP